MIRDPGQADFSLLFSCQSAASGSGEALGQSSACARVGCLLQVMNSDLIETDLLDLDRLLLFLGFSCLS